MQRFQAEIDANEHDLKLYRQDEMTELRRQVEMGRAQIGLGDARYQNDVLARDGFRDALEREVQLAGNGVAGGGAQSLSNQARPLLAQARQYEDALGASFAQLEAQVADRAGAKCKQKIDSERANVATATRSSSTGTTSKRTTWWAAWRSATSRSCETAFAASCCGRTSASRSRRGRFAKRNSIACGICRANAPGRSNSSTKS